MTTETEHTREEPSPAPAAFDVVDVLGGFFSLVKRSATLGGSVPLRVAQACVPLLEGNAWGFQIVPQRRIDVRRKLGRWTAAFEGQDALERLFRATLPLATNAGLLAPDSEWARLFKDGPILSSNTRATFRRAPLLVATGLFVKPRDGARLRVSSTKNRRSLAYDVTEAIVDEGEGWTPLVLEIDARQDAFTLTSEIATLGVLPRAIDVRVTPLERALDVAEAHVGFYDREYFDTKKNGDVARKYRRDGAALDRDADRTVDTTVNGEPILLDVVEAGPCTVRASGGTRFHRPSGPVTREGPIDRVTIENAVPFRASFDGVDVRVEPDRAALRAFADATRACWEPWYAKLAREDHPGALLYLTKYVTPHPPGEPHFFVKAPALFRTPRGVSSLLEGASGNGFEIMRGVVETDRFHAAPAVFHLTAHGVAFDVPTGAPLVELFPVSRATSAARFTLTPFGAATPMTEVPS